MSRYLAAVPLLATTFVALTSADDPAVKSFDSNGVKIAYFVQGKGEPVILIHGWLSSAGINWALPGISGEIAKSFQVIALDVRGHGLSDKPTKEEAYGPELVEDVVRLMDHLKIKKAHLVGYSMGGIITSSFVAKHPERVLSATLGGMGWLKQGSVGQFGFAQIGKKDNNPAAVTLCGRSLAKLALTEDELKSIRVPVEVIVGDKDDLIKKLYVDPLVKVQKDWPIVEVKDGNHITCIMRPQFRDEIVTWLKKNAK
jgi:pimeloyl-ACP methyl ester carboxylesterase